MACIAVIVILLVVIIRRRPFRTPLSPEDNVQMDDVVSGSTATICSVERAGKVCIFRNVLEMCISLYRGSYVSSFQFFTINNTLYNTNTTTQAPAEASITRSFVTLLIPRRIGYSFVRYYCDSLHTNLHDSHACLWCSSCHNVVRRPFIPVVFLRIFLVYHNNPSLNIFPFVPYPP